MDITFGNDQESYYKWIQTNLLPIKKNKPWKKPPPPKIYRDRPLTTMEAIQKRLWSPA